MKGCKTLYYVDSGAPFVLSRQRAVFIYVYIIYTVTPPSQPLGVTI